jgi:hypothetical protein
VVVDNARRHSERWAKLPQNMRKHLLRSLETQSDAESSSNSACSRWDQDDSTRSNRTNGSGERMCAVPLPPSQPQRQKSSGGEPTPSYNAAVPVLSQSRAPPLPPSQPQRQKSIEVQDWAPGPRSSQSSMQTLREKVTPKVPRTPRRKPSHDLRTTNTFQRPQIPQSQPLKNTSRKKHMFTIRAAQTAGTDGVPGKRSARARVSQPLLADVPVGKRSSASLIDDSDDESDCEYGNHTSRPEDFSNAFNVIRGSHGF